MSSAPRESLDLIRYVVFPTDSENATQIVQTETLLKSLQSGAAIIPKRTQDGTTIWFVKSTNADLKDVISGLEGVSFVEQEASSELTRRDISIYSASAKESSNIKETEEFLNSKIQGGTEYRRILDDDGMILLGWGGLVLDEDAAKVVEEYEGIEYPLMVGEVGKD